MARRCFNPGRRSSIAGRLLRIVCLLLAVPLLSGCMIIAGERSIAEGDRLVTEFVSAEGSSERSLQVSDGPAVVEVSLEVVTQSGLLTVELLGPEGEVVYKLDALAASGPLQSGRQLLRTDEQGRLHYRLLAQSAREARIELNYELQ